MIKLSDIKNKKNVATIVSLGGHLSLLLMMGLYFEFSKPIINLGSAPSNAIASYLVANSSTHQELAQNDKSDMADKSQKEQSLDKEGITLTNAKLSLHHSTLVSHSNTMAVQPKASGNEKEVSELIALLHQAIQRQQHYPEMAMEMQREGRVTLEFTLHENGEVSALRIAHSSGTESLDAAAIAAVNQSVPFHQVEKYIHGPQEYRIDVVFELA